MTRARGCVRHPQATANPCCGVDAWQFGFVTLFVVAYPLAPLLAFINNMFEVRPRRSMECVATRRVHGARGPLWLVDIPSLTAAVMLCLALPTATG